jgi:SAM-dependent methyltransferase
MGNKISLIDRAKSYNIVFPNYPPLAYTDRWIYGIWMIGNNYQSKQNFYGEYPPTYLARVMSMFPDVEDILHLFSGSLEYTMKGTNFDINQNLNPDVVGDANHLSNYFLPDTFDLIMADPPYSNEDAEHYGTPMVNRNKVLSECYKVLKPEGFICWLDQVLPMYRKVELLLVGTIGIIRSTNHRFRVLCIFQKVNHG